MSIGPLEIAASAAGVPLAQTKGSAAHRAGEEVGADQRAVYYEQEAAAAAGVGEPDGENHEATDRDADGRRDWEDVLPEGGLPPDTAEAPQSKDPSRQSGTLLDLTG